jgi:septal ring factor EnvC (AmiA/AmiB activator)
VSPTKQTGNREWPAFRIVLVFVALALTLPVSAQKPSREAELASLRAEISQLSAELEAVRRTRTGLEGEVAAADLELRLQGARLAEAVAARDLAARQVAEGEREVGRLEALLEEARRDLRQRLAGLYRLGRQGYLRLVLSLKPDERFLPSVRLLRYLARRDRIAVDRFQQARQQLARERERLVARREETERWIGQEEERRRALQALRERKALLLARAEREQRTLLARSRELEARERKLSNFLDLLYGRNTASLAGTPMPEFRGVLDWPVEGRVTEKFGFRLDPRYKTRVPQNGIDLATLPGAEVKVVFPGKVVFAAPFQGYGPTVIVQHPGRCFSLYAGLAGLKVGPEGMVSLGDAVGLASDKLYFEIRVENRPEDPLTWLR